MTDVSISIVTYNNGDIIKDTVNNLINHIDNINYKIYLIDNKSQDKTVEILNSIQKNNDNVCAIFNKDNIGFGAAHNIVLNNINSKYHLIMNPDIIIENHVIKDLKKYMDKHINIGLLTPLIKFPDGSIQHSCRRKITFIDLFIRRFLPDLFRDRQHYHLMKDKGYNKPFEVEFASGSFMFFRTKIFRKISGFDDNFFMYLEDADITRRVNKISKTVFFPYNYVIHKWERGSYKNLKLFIYHLRSLFYYFQKWGFKLH
jgi:hypothetical protein